VASWQIIKVIDTGKTNLERSFSSIFQNQLLGVLTISLRMASRSRTAGKRERVDGLSLHGTFVFNHLNVHAEEVVKWENGEEIRD